MSSNNLLAKFGSLLAEADAPVEVPVPFDVRDNITHKLTFHKGRAKNFRSIGNEFMEIDYQRNQATLVTSDDNGAGKSTMLVWLLFYVLYNDTYSKKEKKAGLVNSQNRKDCVGEVEFSCRGSEWLVRRGIKPDFVEVHQKVDGEWKQVVNDAAKADTNKYIVNLVGVDQKMFENSLILGKEKYIPFSEMYTADRRSMVETIWDLGFFSLMNEDVKSEIKATNATLTDIDNNLSLKRVDHDNKLSQLSQINESNALIQQQSADTLVQEKERLVELDKDITAHQDELYHFNEAVDKANVEITEVEAKLDVDSQAEIKSINEEYARKIKDVEAEAEGKAEDYERIEVYSARAALVSVNANIEKHVNEKLELVDKRNANADLLAKAIARDRQGMQFKVRFQTELEGHQSAIKRFHDMGVCPTCTQVVSDETKGRIESEYKPKIDDAQGNIDKIVETLLTIEGDIEGYQHEDGVAASMISSVDQVIDGYKEEKAEIEANLVSLARDIKGFHEAAAIEVASLKRECQSKILANRQALNVRFEDITASLQQARTNASNSAVLVTSKIGELKARRAPLVASIADLERKLAVQPTPTINLEMVIAGIAQGLADLEEQRRVADEHLQDLQSLLYFLKDDQTKARIIALYLPFLNSKINEYLEALNMFLDIVVDDTFEITMSAAGRKGQSIFSLSTGQRARLNLAVTLALRDVANLKASVQCNLFVMDEILENMSERGVQESVEMLKHKFGGNNLFVISQREQEFQEYFQHNIRYGLRNGMTEVITKD